MGANNSSYPMATSAECASGSSENAHHHVPVPHPSTSDSVVSTRSIGGGVGIGMTVATGSAHLHRDQRRKRVTGFATLKRKFIRRRRSSKVCDHARVLRDFVSDWTPPELAALCEEFEALAALRDLSMQAELARPPATTYKQDLAVLYDLNLCTDCDLVFRGTIFPVHRSILSSRCTYFRDLLSGCPGFGARICLELPSSPIDVQIFSSLLRYLYTGDLCSHDPTVNINLLRQLGNDFGTPNPLDHDLRYLLETGDYADAALVFTAENTNEYVRQDSLSSEYGFRPKLELPCHKAILSARSPFFRNLIARRTRNIDEYVERSIHVPTRIVLDETVIPKRYARVLLNAIYLDTVDLALILRGAGTGSCAGSLGEVHALTNTGRVRPSTLEEAMELYQIGRFLELDILAQGCEDLILEWLSLDTLSMVLKWGCQPYGSAWVFRQACQFLREEFATVSASPVLNQIDKAQLVHILQSNFLQASELEVLQAVLKWGEQELLRRMEDREPNLLSHTTHSVARKGLKKRDLSDVELREILSELLPLVRMDHVLPPNSEVLCQAIRRGLVSTPPSHMMGDERENLRVNAWIRGGKSQGLFVRPRLFMPYFEEVKALLEDRIATSHHQVELTRMRRSRHFPDIPDTLYMVSRMNSVTNREFTVGIAGGVCGDSVDKIRNSIPTPDSDTIAAMRKREHKLRQSPMCQRALLLPLSSKHEIERQIRLRVVREFNLPDEVSNLLETSLLPTQDSVRRKGECNSADSEVDQCLKEAGDQSPPPSPAANVSALQTAVAASFLSTSSMASSVASQCVMGGLQECYSRNLTFPRHQQSSLLGVTGFLAVNSGAALQSSFARLSTSVHHRRELPALITEGDYRVPLCNSLSIERGGEGGASGSDTGNGHLSDMMPDVAMATASMGQLHLSTGVSGGVSNVSSRSIGSNNDMSESLHLDLGDGPTPHIITTPAGLITLRNLQNQLPQRNYHHIIQHSNSQFDILRHGQHSPAQQPPSSGALNTGPPRFL